MCIGNAARWWRAGGLSAVMALGGAAAAGSEANESSAAPKEQCQQRVWVSPLNLLLGSFQGDYHRYWTPKTYIGGNLLYNSNVEMKLGDGEIELGGNLVGVSALVGRGLSEPSENGGSAFGEAGLFYQEFSYKVLSSARRGAGMNPTHLGGSIFGVVTKAGYQWESEAGWLARLGGELFLVAHADVVFVSDQGSESIRMNQASSVLSALIQVGYAF